MARGDSSSENGSGRRRPGGEKAHDKPADGVQAIVSSAHLATGSMPMLSAFEFGLITASHAFQRWIVRGMAAAGEPDLSPLDVLILHTVNHRDRAKKIADICLVLNIEDTYTVIYAARKLEKRGLVASGRAGKEKRIEITDAGRAVCERYRDVREQLLVAAVEGLGVDPDQLAQLATLLRALSGQYDQAARGALTL